MNNVFFAGLLQAAKSNNVQFILILFCLSALFIFLGSEFIASFKVNEPSSDWSFGIFHSPSMTVIKTFSSVGDCVDYFEKNFAGEFGYYWFIFDHVGKRVWYGIPTERDFDL